MKRSISTALILIVLLIAATACNAPSPNTTPDLSIIVAQTQTAIAVSQALTPAVATTAAPSGAVETGAAPTQSIQVTPEAPGVTETPETTEAACTLRAKYVAETIPDNTQFAPGEAFVKTWTLQNVGTCTWTPEFSIVFLRGEQMGGTSPAPIGQTVAPNGTIQLFLPQTAPEAPGEHQGFWVLRDLNENQFALGDDAATPFWVKINVVSGLATATAPAAGGGLNLGPATLTHTFDDNRAPFFLGESDDNDYTVRDGRLVVTAFEPAGDLWRVAERSGVDNFALEARFRTGSACSGKDGYGLLVRAPSQSDDIIDSGYVFGFNCEGQYRVYRMDNGGYTGIQSWATHPSLRPGPNQDNVMTVQAVGDRLQLYGNGTLLYEFFDAAYPSGLWGLMVGAANTLDFQVSVDSVSLWDLP